jgi:hypothetical protein
MVKSQFLSFVSFMLACALAKPALTDHAPEWLLSKVQPETRLAGIAVGETTVAGAERRFGRAHTSRLVSEDGTETEYTWHLALSELRVTTMHPPRAPRENQVIYAIEVRQREGRQSKARTGAGVSVGTTLDALVDAYGTRYMTSWRNLSAESATVTFIFSNETELSAGFSDSGRIISLLLVESQE